MHTQLHSVNTEYIDLWRTFTIKLLAGAAISMCNAYRRYVTREAYFVSSVKSFNDSLRYVYFTTSCQLLLQLLGNIG